jgi:hypothetical protein
MPFTNPTHIINLVRFITLSREWKGFTMFNMIGGNSRWHLRQIYHNSFVIDRPLSCQNLVIALPSWWVFGTFRYFVNQSTVVTGAGVWLAREMLVEYLSSIQNRQGRIQDLEKEGGAGRFTLKFTVNFWH